MIKWQQLLRSSLVNNKTQAIICDDLGMTSYVINNDPKVKERMENEKNKVFQLFFVVINCSNIDNFVGMSLTITQVQINECEFAQTF